MEQSSGAGVPESAGVCSWSVGVVDGRPLIRVHGEVDRVVVGALRETIDTTVHGTREPVTLDLSEVGFLDSTGVTMLLEARLEHGERLRLHDLSGWVVHVLELAGLTDVLVDR